MKMLSIACWNDITFLNYSYHFGNAHYHRAGFELLSAYYELGFLIDMISRVGVQRPGGTDLEIIVVSIKDKIYKYLQIESLARCNALMVILRH